MKIECLQSKFQDGEVLKYIVVINKINELVEAVNDLEAWKHTHQTMVDSTGKSKCHLCKNTGMYYNKDGNYRDCTICVKLPQGKSEKSELPKEFQCEYCKEDKRIRNPTRKCDHLYYPEYANKEYKAEPQDEVGEEELTQIINNYCSRRGFTEYSDCARYILKTYKVVRR